MSYGFRVHTGANIYIHIETGHIHKKMPVARIKEQSNKLFI